MTAGRSMPRAVAFTCDTHSISVSVEWAHGRRLGRSVEPLLAAIILRSMFDLPLRFATLPIRHIDQASNSADKRILITGQKTIGVGHFPQHLDDADTLFLAEFPDDNLGKVMEIGRLDRAFFCRLNQLRYLARRQAEAPGQEPLDYALFASLNSVVAAGNFDKQHGKSEGGIVLFAGLTDVIDTPQKGKQSFEHVQFLEAEARDFGASTGLFETMRITHSNARVNRGIVRIASPEMFPEAEMLPHLICSRPMFIGGAKDEADQHGGA
jgi:hypothetical protein